MTHHRRKVDTNQREIVYALRDMKATVCDLSGVGKGCPDLLVGFRGVNLVMEVVGPDKLARYKPHGLMPNQLEWHEGWAGKVCVVRTIDEAVNAVHGISQGVIR